MDQLFTADKDTTLLRASEVARRLDVDRSTIYRWAYEGKIPCVRLPGDTIRFHPEELEEWLRG